MKKRLFSMVVVFLLISNFVWSDDDLDLLQAMSKGLIKIVKKVQPSVVTITSEKTIKLSTQMPNNGIFGPDFWQYFFGVPRNYKEKSLGSGIIITDTGYILTNNHVVKDADEIKVYTKDDKEYKAEIVGTDPGTDIALIKIEPEGDELVPIELGNSDKVEVGELVLALGSPFQLKETVTLGIISAKGRTNLGLIQYENFLQTDAAINPGNSGGALVNMKGQLIGINSAIVSRSGGNNGIGLAIPINLAKRIEKDLKIEGRVVRGWLGAGIQDINEEMANILGLDNKEGVLISQVLKGSPAEKGGLKRGDIIVEYDGEKVANADDLKRRVAFTSPETEVEIKIIRNGDTKILTVEIGEKEDNFAKGHSTSKYDKKLGITIRNLTPALASEYNYDSNEKGVIIVKLEKDSPLNSPEIGLKEGDIIKEIIYKGNRKEITNKKDYNKAIKKIDSDDNFAFLIKRNDNTFYVPIKMP